MLSTGFSGPTRPVSGYGSRQMREYGDVYDNLACTFQFADGRIAGTPPISCGRPVSLTYRKPSCASSAR
jgi:hypothetical protein